MRIRLRYKLFLTILLANALLTAVIVIANNRAFSTGFETYLNEVQSRRLAPLLDRLADEYQRQNGWHWVGPAADRWQALAHPYFDGRDDRRAHDKSGRHSKRDFGPLLLRDDGQRLLIGDPALTDRTAWLAITVDGRTVGELGVPRNVRLTSEFDRLFAEQQQRQLRWIAVVALLLSAAVAIPFAGALVRPISRLQKATHELAGGHYDVSLPSEGRDELAELARDFNALAGTLSRNLEARQRWIADISHELRTPIAVLQAELEALQDGVRQPDSATLQSLHQEIVRLGGLVADLHELSLSDAGALSYQKKPVDFARLVEEVIGHHQTALAEAGLECRFERPERAVTMEGDPNRLMQLLTNLMVNSLSYTEAPGQVHIELRQDRAGIRLSWSDSTPGVPAEALPRLFERLYRVEGSRNRATGGSGLGLAIVSNVVAAHQGTVTARPSTLGGLTIDVRFPTLGTQETKE